MPADIQKPLRIVRYLPSDQLRPRCTLCRSSTTPAVAAAWRGQTVVAAWCHPHFTARPEDPNSEQTWPDDQ